MVRNGKGSFVSADNNLHTKINAILSRELLLEETPDSFHLELVESQQELLFRFKAVNGSKASATD